MHRRGISIEESREDSIYHRIVQQEEKEAFWRKSWFETFSLSESLGKNTLVVLVLVSHHGIVIV